MYAQVIEGHVADRDALQRQLDVWADKVRPDAVGFLGSTVGVAPDGSLFVAARFESLAAAEANSHRPDQHTWWQTVESECLSGPATFHNTGELELLLDINVPGRVDAAGFVQVVKGRVTDRARLRDLDDIFGAYVATFQPEVLGSFRVWVDLDSYIEAVYFTSRAAARAAQQRDPASDQPEMAQVLSEHRELLKDVTRTDIPDLWLFS